MVDQAQYWARVEGAALACALRPGCPCLEVALGYTVLPSDLRKRMRELEGEQARVDEDVAQGGGNDGRAGGGSGTST